MKDNIYRDLSNFCRWNDNTLVNRLLKESPELDILYQEGRFLDFAIKHNNIKMLEDLLKYFENTQLQGDTERLEYKVAKHKLQEILKDAVDTFDISEEMQIVLNQYIPKGDDDLEQNLGSFENLTSYQSPSREAEQGRDHDENNDLNLALAGKDVHFIDSH